jgi:hypothetical protein
MRGGICVAWLSLGLNLLLCSCASVDQFGSRIRDGNLNSQDALNQETLLNIIRARDLQPLNFFAITQVTGGQSEALTTGLPVVTIGPGTTTAQHQAVITNSLASGVTGGYQGNPLVSTQFQSGMLSPIDEKTVAWLIASHPREPVFYAVMDQIVFRQVNTGKVFAFVGDPARDKFPDCATRIARTSPDKYPGLTEDCDYSLFLNYLGMFVTGGLTSELIAAPAPAKPKSSGTTSSTPPSPPPPIGHICFNPALSSLGAHNPACGQTKLTTTAKKPLQFTIRGFGVVQTTFVFRSPLGVFAHFGELLRYPGGNRAEYHTVQANTIIGNEPYLNIISANGGPCLTSVLYDGRFYCVPAYSLHTAMLIDILIQLRNLSIQPSDLNSAFTVRLTD